MDFEDSHNEEKCEECKGRGWINGLAHITKNPIKRICHECEGAGFVAVKKMTRDEYEQDKDIA